MLFNINNILIIKNQKIIIFYINFIYYIKYINYLFPPNYIYIISGYYFLGEILLFDIFKYIFSILFDLSLL